MKIYCEACDEEIHPLFIMGHLRWHEIVRALARVREAAP